MDIRINLKIYEQNTFKKRFTGLMFKSYLPKGIGYLFKNCRSVHTCFMKQPIMVIALDKDYQVLNKKTVVPWRVIRFKKPIKHIIECRVDEDIKEIK